MHLGGERPEIEPGMAELEMSMQTIRPALLVRQLNSELFSLLGSVFITPGYIHSQLNPTILNSWRNKKWFKVHLTPKYFFRLNESLHLFEMHCAFLPLFNPNFDFLQAVKVTKSGHHLLHDQEVRGMGLFLV